MSDQLLASILVLLAFGGLGLLIVLHRTVLLGFTAFCFLNIASASFGGLFVTRLFGLSDRWITPEHSIVFISTALGLLAFCVGVMIVWVPLRRTAESVALRPIHDLPWLSERLILTFAGVSIGIYALFLTVLGITTLRSIWSALTELLKYTLLLATIYALTRRNYRPLLLTLVIFVPLVLYQAVFTGFISFAGLFLLQLLMVVCFWRGVRLWSFLLMLAGLTMMASLVIGWLNSRSLIREGYLDDLGATERITVFLQEFNYVNPLAMQPTEIQAAVFERIDMTSILTAQVRQQPTFTPFTYGVDLLPDLAVALVPRVLWPDKPVIAGGNVFVSGFTGIVFDEDTSVGLPYQFELYSMGGTPAVIVGLFLLGLAVANLELRLLAPATSLTRLLLLLYLTSTLASGAQTLVLLISSALSGTLGYLVIGRALDMSGWFTPPPPGQQSEDLAAAQALAPPRI